MIRTIASFIFVVGVSGGLFAEETTPSVGDEVFVSMTGNLAKEYARLTFPDSPKTDGISSVQIVATVAQKLDGGRFRIENFSPIQATGKPPRLVSFSTIIEASQLETETTPKNTALFGNINIVNNNDTAIFGSIGNVNIAPASVTQNEHKSLKLVLSETKGVKLQSWKLDVEVAN